MTKWEVTLAGASSGRLAELLKEGWEPFAVTTEPETAVKAANYQRYVWLRRIVAK